MVPLGWLSSGTSNIAAAELRAPAHDETIVLVNTDRYGGCGGSRAVYSAANAAATEIAVHELKADVVNHDLDASDGDKKDADGESDALSPANHLTPRAAATLREAFEDSTRPLADVTPASDDGVDNAAREELPEMNTRVPGVTDSELARYRRQMYRIDI